MSRRAKVLIIAGGVVAVALIVWFAAHSAKKLEVKAYPMTGMVIVVHPEAKMARVHNDDMPGFMRPMEMDYQLLDADASATLKPGDTLKATLMSDGHEVWQLKNIEVTRKR